MEKDLPKMRKDLNIPDKQFIQKIRREDFYFLIGTFKHILIGQTEKHEKTCESMK